MQRLHPEQGATCAAARPQRTSNVVKPREASLSRPSRYDDVQCRGRQMRLAPTPCCPACSSAGRSWTLFPISGLIDTLVGSSRRFVRQQTIRVTVSTGLVVQHYYIIAAERIRTTSPRTSFIKREQQQQQSVVIQIGQCPGHAVNTRRFLNLRRLSTFRPLCVRTRLRKPCRRFRMMLLG